jgi:23S rRNA (guanosine2251-2'-O)-methyltransferase
MSDTKLSMDSLNRLSKNDFNEAVKSPVTIIIDQVRSGLNIGSIFRSADAFRIQKIFLTGFSPLPPNKEILKTALGATDTVAWEHVPDAIQLVQTLKKEGYKIYAIEQTQNSIPLHEFNYLGNHPIAIILGNEVEGVQQSLINLSDASIEIPQFGTKHSLNVAVCGGIILWHLTYAQLKQGINF